MPAIAHRSTWITSLLAGFVGCALFAVPATAQYLADRDDDSGAQSSGFGQTDPSDAPTEVHYHFHNHYHSPYLSHYDSAGTPNAGGPGNAQFGAQPFTPNGVAGANHYYTPRYLKSSRTASPSTRFLGDTEDAGPTEDMDSTDSGDASSNDEVGENVDQPPASSFGPPNSYLPASGSSRQTGEITNQSGYAFGPRALPGDRAYLRVIVPAPNTKLIYDGHEVAGKGLLRSLMTARIQPGQSLVYTLVAYWKDPSGNPRVSVHEAAISAGDHQTVEFNVATSGNND